ncbi:MAG: class A beta-lactamase [Silvibacterium sp.]
MRFVLIFALVTSSAFAQSPLQQKIRAIAVDAHGKVSVACSLPGSNLDCDLNAHAHPPMQSVFKFPLALTVLHQVEQGKFSLDQPIRFLPGDRILPHTHSLLQDKYPQAGVDVPLRELLRLAVSLSDNAAADILLRIAGGPTVVDDYMHSLGITGFHLQDGEDGLHRDVSAQYRNWFEPASAVRLLRRINDHSPLTPENTQTLLNWMKATSTGPSRIRGELPEGTVVMDKTGSSGTDNGLTHATNDIGLVTLPDGRRLAIAVFVTDSTGGEKACDAVIARIAKAAYDAGVATTH